MEDEKPNIETTDPEAPEVIDGELVLAGDDEIDPEEETKLSSRKDESVGFPELPGEKPSNENTAFYFQYILLPLVFITVTLLGGLRIGVEDGEFLFLRPALICLIYSAILLVLFFRAKLIDLEGWFSDKFGAAKNIANGLVIFTLFAASTQVFNSLIPESGLPFWIIAFCFFWTLWNNLFSEFDTRRLLQSLGGLFGLAFIVKYLLLANLVSAEEGSWITRVWQNPTKEAFAYFLDIRRFSSATGYIQFFTLILYLIGLFVVRPSSSESK
ncbi:MAG: hypothetical protein HKN25_01840 [Pyrinomonadaceae bacterium]|nr:hypothetical protein [Pyrinomonadaceae bacterium]